MPSEPADAYSPQRSQSFDDELTGDPFQDEPDDFAGEAQWERPLPPAQPANGQPMSGRTTLDLAVVRLPEASSPATSLAPEAQAEADASAPSPVVEWWAWAR
ncbi:MAG TPA: hypothetical protein VNK95_20755, partial [Caldilineaceae bacterium]|nr:hypothetical protein [Caldilineaceae bacterium]